MAVTLHGDEIYGKIDFTGLKDDPKPIENVKTEATFYELDTFKTWIYNAQNINPLTGNGWWEKNPTLDGGAF